MPLDNKCEAISPTSEYTNVVFQEDIVGKNIDDIVLPDQRKSTESSLCSQLKGAFGKDKTVWETAANGLPDKIKRERGSLKQIIKLTYTPLWDKSNKLKSVLVVAEDVTEVERLREEAAQHQKNIENILNNLGQGFMTIDRGGLILPGSSTAASDFFGTDPSQKRFVDILQASGDSAESIIEWFEMICDLTLDFEDLVALGPKSFEKLGSRYIELDYRPIYSPSKDQLDKLICIASDKTAERNFATKPRLRESFLVFSSDIQKINLDFTNLFLKLKIDFHR